ncbi:MAG: hypothetical protein R6X02_19925 [Enhygromyxa sp.]
MTLRVPRRAAELLDKSRQRLRKEIRRRPVLHRLAKEALVGFKLVRQRVRQGKHEPLHGWGAQAHRYPIPFAGADVDALRAALREHSLRFAEGRHTLYLPPQPGREALLGAEFVAAFPPEVGVKLLKNFAPPSRARYHHQGGLAEAALIGPIGNQVLASAALFAYGLGPRPLDLVHLAGPRADLSAIVSEHVEGRTPSAAEHQAFIAELRQLEGRGLFRLANPSRYDCGDFASPDCNANLITSPAGPRYVDPQVFLFDEARVVADVLAAREDTLHFGDVLTVVRSGQRFLYQEVPGASSSARRGTGERWQAIEGLLARHRVRLDRRVVFDVCCNSGMMMHGSLARGAHWAFGWDLPAVADAADRLLPLLGSGRTTVFGRELGLDTDLRADLPEWAARWSAAHGGLCLFLAAWHHIDFPPGIGELPWTDLIYEGRENEPVATTDENIATMSERWRARELERITIRDGLCGPRPLALLRRSDER